MARGSTLLLILSIGLVVTVAPLCPHPADACRILVVMSYNESYIWEKDIRRGIEAALSPRCELRFFYMDTKHNLAGGARKAREAFELYQTYKPSGVIAADDNAQSLFVVPYLRNKVATPVIFCGVNASPDTYGYPTDNVSGVLERQHFRETIAFAQMLKPDIHSIAIMMRQTPTTAALRQQIKREIDSYPARILATIQVKTLREAEQALKKLGSECDAVILTNLNGLADENDTPITEEAAFSYLTKGFDRPILGAIPDHVKYGALLTVASSGIEQGNLAAGMMVQCLEGTPVADLPIARNLKGQRLINLKTMRALGIHPIPAVLVGVRFYEGK
ncbi:MAG: ABC transporter substrate binding protein [Desulfosarcinaceae bacterium]|jgi:ABC-type uncharacterized transport system substrate-binding protein